ncbi:hypothetical protein Y032_0010g1140 [Ancylostoma ceylanicum]|uniref:Uncharacterized protein n=1 Tax=Ancylostoma ceylanicum TaxID=53326 RepID=A0A016VI05_9BILA|nr:hypothetical protein Y032_0010g1140 [Ancylostoma ceylanicum]
MATCSGKKPIYSALTRDGGADSSRNAAYSNGASMLFDETNMRPSRLRKSVSEQYQSIPRLRQLKID